MNDYYLQSTHQVTGWAESVGIPESDWFSVLAKIGFN